VSLGKLIYTSAFSLHKNMVLLLSPTKADIWFRNSLLQDYFSFGKSDIDVSLLLEKNPDASDSIKKISAQLQFCPLIKELNFYYPFSLNYAGDLINAFELKKDPVLAKKLQSQNNTRADQFVYLLRMAFANHHQKQFTHRDVKKWSFHFHLVGADHLISSLQSGMPRLKLLQLIVLEYSPSSYPLLANASDDFINEKPLYDQFISSKEQRLLYLLLPQHFCFADIDLRDAPLFELDIFLSQMSWEIWAMMTQPELFKAGGPGHGHLDNLIKALQKNLNSEGHDKRRITLLKTAEDFRSFNLGRL